MTTFKVFLNKFPERNQETVRRIIVHGGGWSAYEPPKSYPQDIPKSQWYDLWNSTIRTKSLLHYYLLHHGTAEGFTPTFYCMSSCITHLEQRVIDYVTAQYKDSRKA